VVVPIGASPSNGLRSSTTTSALAPSRIVPASASWFTYALPQAYAAIAVGRSIRCDGSSGWASGSPTGLLRVYAKCISGQQYEAKRRIEEGTRPRDDE
jgi:hypothetical protein